MSGKAVLLMRRWILWLLTVVVAVPAIAQPHLLQVEVKPLFGTTVPPFGCLPLKITVQNRGPSVETAIVVTVERWQGRREYVFPLSLPTGSRKEVLALPFITMNVMRVSVQLRGLRGIPPETLQVSQSEIARVVVGVGDEIGGLEWLRQLTPQQPTPSRPPIPTRHSGPPEEWLSAYCRPEDLPNKAAGLTGVSVIVLGSGAERLSNSQWQALRHWVMMGGVLVVPGGSAAVYLRHKALASLLPIENWRTVQWRDWNPLARRLQTLSPPDAAFITVGKLKKDAQLLAGTPQVPLVAVRRWGWGAVVFTAFNLWDKPFRGWQGLVPLWKRSVVPLTRVTVAARWREWILPLGTWEGWKQGHQVSGPIMMPSPPIGRSPISALQPPPLPFHIELPSVLNLAVVLLLYFALVVPIAYHLLQRKGKLDWHWLIAPVLAVAFVFIIGRATWGLYQIGTQNLTQGLIVASEGANDAYLFAGTTLFLQRAGNYLLDFGTAEATFGAIRDEIFEESDFRTQEDPNPTTFLRVPNLSFRLFFFAKPLTLNGIVRVHPQWRGNRLLVTVVNRLPFPMKKGRCVLVQDASVRVDPWWRTPWQPQVLATTQLPELAPNETASVTLSVPPRFVPNPLFLVVTATVEGIDITPNLNAPAHRKSFVTFQVVCPVKTQP